MDDPFCRYGESNNMKIQEIAMPFKIQDYYPQKWGLWPFCVHGGDHPEGHGGIDFELKKDTPILASCDGTVEFIKAETSGVKDHGSSLMLRCDRIVIGYNGLTNIQVNMGDALTKGQAFAKPAKLQGTYYIHWEINDFYNQKLVCPLDYLDSEFRNFLKINIDKARYPKN